MTTPVTAQDLFNAVGKHLSFRWISSCHGQEALLRGDFPGAAQQALVGSLNLIHPNRIQVIGHSELIFLSDMDAGSYRNAIDRLLSYQPAAVLFSDGIDPLQELVEAAELYHTPMISSPLEDSQLISNLNYFLTHALAERVTLHGVFIEVLGMGVLLSGDSAVGKSELALALISRGHRLIADDATEFARVAPDIISGSCPALLQDLLEVRGLGILNIRSMYGDSAVRRKKNLHLIIHLAEMNDDDLARMDRLQGSRSSRKILGISVPQITIPIAQGRNLAILVEAAVQNHALQLKGYNASTDFAQRQQAAILKKEG